MTAERPHFLATEHLARPLKPMELPLPEPLLERDAAGQPGKAAVPGRLEPQEPELRRLAEWAAVQREPHPAPSMIHPN